MLSWEQLDYLLVAGSELFHNQVLLEMGFWDTGEKSHQVIIHSSTF